MVQGAVQQIFRKGLVNMSANTDTLSPKGLSARDQLMFYADTHYEVNAEGCISLDCLELPLNCDKFIVSGAVHTIDLCECADEDSLEFSGWSGHARLVLPDSCKSIGDYCFYRSNIRGINLENIESIGKLAFYASLCSSITGTRGKLVLPRLKKIGNGAFVNCNIKYADLRNLDFDFDMGMDLFGRDSVNADEDRTVVLPIARYDIRNPEIGERLIALNGKYKQRLQKLILNKTFKDIPERLLMLIFGITDLSVIEYVD